MTLRPWMKWYPADWRADPRLRMCSIGARGLWVEMIALMHEAEPYGHLVISGAAPSNRQLASLVGASTREVSNAITELEQAGVFSRTDDGVIYSRRMVRDNQKAKQDQQNGKKGGNPKVKGGVNPPPNPSGKGPDKAQRPEARDTPNGDGKAVSDETAQAYQAAREIFGTNPDPGTVVSKLLSLMPPAEVLSAVHTARIKDNGWQYLWGVYKRKSADKRGKQSKNTHGDRAWEAING